jgi:hypothetical protein
VSAFVFWLPDFSKQIQLAQNQLLTAEVTTTTVKTTWGTGPDVEVPSNLNLLSLNGNLAGAQIIWFDATMTEVHGLANDVTEHPVEDGPDITDHIRPQQDTFRMTAFVTNHPYRTVDQILADLPRQADLVWGAQTGSVKPLALEYTTSPFVPGLSNAINAVGNALASGQGLQGQKTFLTQTLQFDQQFDNVSEVYEALRTLKDDGTLVEIVTSIRSYEDMVVKEVVMDRDPQTGDGARFTIDFKQVRIVTTATVPAPKEVSAQAKVDKGMKGSKPNTPQKIVSFAAKGSNGAGITDAGTGITQ